MATIQSFEELKVSQKARILSSEIFLLTSIGSFSKDYGLKDQINRSSGSIMDNIELQIEITLTKKKEKNYLIWLMI